MSRVPFGHTFEYEIEAARLADIRRLRRGSLDHIVTTILGWYSEWDTPAQRAKLARIWARHGVPQGAVKRIRELYAAQHG